MYYDKEEYTKDVDWFAELITKQLGERWKPIKGNDECHAYRKDQRKDPSGLCGAEGL